MVHNALSLQAEWISVIIRATFSRHTGIAGNSESDVEHQEGASSEDQRRPRKCPTISPRTESQIEITAQSRMSMETAEQEISATTSKVRVSVDQEVDSKESLDKDVVAIPTMTEEQEMSPTPARRNSSEDGEEFQSFLSNLSQGTALLLPKNGNQLSLDLDALVKSTLEELFTDPRFHEF